MLKDFPSGSTSNTVGQLTSSSQFVESSSFKSKCWLPSTIKRHWCVLKLSERNKNRKPGVCVLEYTGWVVVQMYEHASECGLYGLPIPHPKTSRHCQCTEKHSYDVTEALTLRCSAANNHARLHNSFLFPRADKTKALRLLFSPREPFQSRFCVPPPLPPFKEPGTSQELAKN